MDDAHSCHLCHAALPEGQGLRCPDCGLHTAAGLGRSAYFRLVLSMAGVYGLTALAVVVTRG